MVSIDYDFLIIGAGGVGLAAAMYSARLGLKTLVLGTISGTEAPVGGVITTTHVVENYPGFITLTGEDLAKKLEDHARSYDLVDIKVEKAIDVKKLKSCFIVKTEKGEYKTKTILFATGTKWKTLNIPGSKEFENKGVSYCALCDAPLYKNKILGLVGGSDSAAKDAMVLTEHAEKVYIIYRGDQIHPEPINMDRVNQNKKIEIINNTNILKIKGSQFIEEVIFDKSYKKSKEFKLQGLFIAIGHIVLSDLAQPLKLKLNKKGEIMTDKEAKTNIPGVFAAGDVADTPFKQLITGVAEGCIAAYSAYEHITKEKVLVC